MQRRHSHASENVLDFGVSSCTGEWFLDARDDILPERCLSKTQGSLDCLTSSKDVEIGVEDTKVNQRIVKGIIRLNPK